MSLNFIKELCLIESERQAAKETQHVVDVVNSVYNEWKKVGRRKNATDLITTATNKISNIEPEFIDKVHEATRLKIAAIIVRCLDIQTWKSVDTKHKVYTKLSPLIKRLETYDPNTGTGGNLRQVIMTRLSAAISAQSENKEVFAVYEPTMPASYIKYLFGAEEPAHIIRFESLPLPPDFDMLIKILTANHEKAITFSKTLTK